MPKKVSLLKSLLFYLPAIVIPGLLKWGSVPIFVNLMDTNEYANYALFIATIGMLSSLNSWIGMAVVRYYPEYEKKDAAYSFGISMLLISISFALMIVGIVAIGFISIGNQLNIHWSLIILGILIFLFSEYSNLLLYILRIQQEIIKYGIFNTWKAIALVVLGGSSIYFFEAKLETLLVGFAVGLVIGLPFLHFFTLRNKKKENINWLFLKREFLNVSFLKIIAFFGLPLMFAEFAVWGLRFSDRWLMGYMASKTELSIYDANYSLMEATILVLVALFQLAIRPYEIRNWEGASDKEVGKMTTKMVTIYLLLVFPTSIIFITISDYLIEILLPEAYWAGKSIIPWVVFAMFFLGLQQRIQSVLVYKKTTNNIALAAVIGLSINLVLNIIFIPSYSFLAASINTTIGYFMFCLIVYLASRKALDWKFPTFTFIKLLIMSAFVLIVINFLKSHFANHVNSIPLLLATIGLCGSMLFFILILFISERNLLIELIASPLVKRKN